MSLAAGSLELSQTLDVTGDAAVYGNLSVEGTVTISSIRILNGNGSPEGAVVGSVGDFYLRKDGTAGQVFYVKESGTGNTGWVAK
jgi:hypothetical protein